MLLLGRMSALGRLAAFLIDLSQRAADQGGSARDLRLRMTRRELGGYLGLTLETVSRSLTILRDLQHLEVDNRDIRIRDLPRFLGVFQARRAWPGNWVRQRTEGRRPARAPYAYR
jgi:CRP/FNR family transcriptional regulator, anaerobic regulatory protein